MPYEHLRVVRDEPVTLRKKNRFPGFPKPSDVRQHGVQLQRSLTVVTEAQAEPGFDERRLLRIDVIEGFRPDDLEVIPGLTVVSQEGRSVALLFSTEDALAVVDQRLTVLARDGNVTYANLLLAIRGFDSWTPADRTGPALAQLGLPDENSSIVDVELWPIERNHERVRLVRAFEELLRAEHIETLDRLNKESLLMFKLRASEAQVDVLLRYRDVRLVDLPPSFRLELQSLQLDINDLSCTRFRGHRPKLVASPLQMQLG